MYSVAKIDMDTLQIDMDDTLQRCVRNLSERSIKVDLQTNLHA